MTAGRDPPNLGYNYLNSFDSSSNFNSMPDFFNTVTPQGMFNMDYYSHQMAHHNLNPQPAPESPETIKPFREEISTSPEANNFITNNSSPLEPYIASTASALNFGANNGMMAGAMNPMNRMINSGLHNSFFPTNTSDCCPTTSFAVHSYPNAPYYPIFNQSRLNPMDLNSTFCTDSRLGRKKDDKNYKTGAGTNNVRVRTCDKYRTVYSEQIRHVLESEFKKSEYLNADRKCGLATQLDMTERQIKIWFQNRRAKDRKRGKNNKIPSPNDVY
ncbi:unnamed protein product [Bursaphelenchus xylophilus]|uniref:(pine wood nematode) hypothetical protein n=1 Tax=Bursaphelenchus xylophilus TaxID=6326 RepID=A0A1I7S7M7_BURXY|nr:unnamed protein product [Bursaphelenchus xylophilus]CAG9112005.1 unnamed protein product [Bursaphelenchus xylophilus]